MGNVLIWLGIILIIGGLALNAGLLDWFGRLPGDLRYEGEHTKIFVPITSMLLVSIVLSIVFNLFRRF